MGYMGHLTLISEDIVTAFSHYPPDLLSVLSKFVPQPDWDDYVSGSYRETKNKDTSLLGGGKPTVGAASTTVVEEPTGGGSVALSPSPAQSGVRTIVVGPSESDSPEILEEGNSQVSPSLDIFRSREADLGHS